MPLSSHSLKPGDLELDLKATFTDRSPGGSPKPPASPISPSPRPSAGPSWQLRLSTESQLAAKGKNAGQEFPVTWYGRALLELCGPCAMELAPQLNELEAHQRSCPYMWKEGGHLPAMLEQCCMMLAKAKAVAIAQVALALLQGSGAALGTALRTAPGAALVRGALEEQLWEDFTCLVPFLESLTRRQGP
eukprot:g2266.t1